MIKDNSIVIEHIFDTPVEKVWEAWTTPELIKKWWGPEGFTAPSIKIDFRVGGKYTFAMHGPDGSQWDRDMYTSGVFKEIVENEKIVVTDYFSDSEGNMIKPSDEGQASEFPTELNSTILFEDMGNGKTKLSIIYPKPENEAQLEAILKSGMEQGWGQSLDKMEKVLKSGNKNG